MAPAFGLDALHLQADAAGGGELDRVGEQIGEDLAEPAWIALHTPRQIGLVGRIHSASKWPESSNPPANPCSTHCA